MHITERLQALRTHCQHHEFEDCGHCERIEEHLDAIQAEVEELLRRIPAQPDTTPAHITLTAS